jgi:hypothetical protein
MNVEHWKKQAEIYKENLLEAKRLFDSKFELTDDEISQVYKEVSEPFGEKKLYEIHDFAKAILRKAQEK